MNKDEALRALQQLRDRLADETPIMPLDRKHLVVTAEYAIEKVTAIEELKRARAVKKTNGGNA